MRPIQVLILADDGSLCKTIAEGLKTAPDIQVAAQAKVVSMDIDILGQLQPDVILLMIGGLGIIDLKAAIRQMLAAAPQTKIIVLHQSGQERRVLQAFRQGAVGHLSAEDIHLDEIIRAIRAVNRGEVVLSPGVAGAILDEIVREQYNRSRS